MIYSQPVFLTRAKNWELSIATVMPTRKTSKGGIVHEYGTDQKRSDFFPFRKGKWENDKPRFFIRRKYFSDLQPGDTIASTLFICIGNRSYFKGVNFEDRDYRGKRSLHFPCYCTGKNQIMWDRITGDSLVEHYRYLSVTKNINLLTKPKNGYRPGYGSIQQEAHTLQAYPEGIERKGLPIRRNSSTPTFSLPLYPGLVNTHFIEPERLHYAMISIVYNEDLFNFVSAFGAHADIMINHQERRFKDGNNGNNS